MWSFQPHFRMGVEHEVQRCLHAIGAELRPVVVLIGFEVEKGHQFPICVEPEDGSLQPMHLSNVEAQAKALFHADPESQIFHTDARLHALRQEGLRKVARARAIAEAIEQSGTHPGRRFFVSRSSPIGGYEVHTCIGIAEEALSLLPRLTGDVFQRVRVAQSLPLEVIGQTLVAADQALYLPDPGSSLYSLFRTSAEIVSRSAFWLAEGCVIRAGELTGGDLFESMQAVTTQPYEGGAAQGRLLIVRPDHPSLETNVRFARPVSLMRSRAVRKLLETTGEGLSLLVRGSEAYGLGRLRSDYEPERQDAFEVVVSAHATWELRHAETALMVVSYGKSVLPRPLVDRARFDDATARIFPGLDATSIERLWRHIEAVLGARHGAMLVISQAAEVEAERLAGQSTRIEPVLPEVETIERLAAIDGAVLLDPTGSCHAIGVILDGTASGGGDPARGARFNSAVRYLATSPHPTMIIVISQDGTIDVLPFLRPRVRPSDIDRALRNLQVVSDTGFDPEAFFRAWEEVEALAFYLNAEQCAQANKLRDLNEERRWESNAMRLSFQPLSPSPEMDDSYFLEES